MSDLGRKGLGEQAKEKVTPDSQKSTLDKVGENVSGLGDKAASAVQPEGQKSTTQKLGDSTRSGGDSAQQQGSGILDSAQQGLSNAGQTISDTFSSATGQKK
ncbi:heat shock protein 9/12-domain-containing protein [Phaeosphaeriaceae sp. PMI808]|nr:heat shock protein 9/12-domain-containing protein [Phaeosphaeriaceae sp. PMI808]